MKHHHHHFIKVQSNQHQLKNRPLMRNTSGFTFIELLIAISVLHIITSIAIPSMTNLLAKTRQTGQLNTFMSHLQLARTEAIFKNKSMLMCKSEDQQSCSNSSDWSQGWLVFMDENNNKQKDEKETLVFSHAELSHVNKILYNSFSGSDDYVLFYSRGYSHTNGTFLFCHAIDIDQSQSIVISRTGRIRSENNLSESSKNKCLPYIKES